MERATRQRYACECSVRHMGVQASLGVFLPIVPFHKHSGNRHSYSSLVLETRARAGVATCKLHHSNYCTVADETSTWKGYRYYSVQRKAYSDRR